MISISINKPELDLLELLRFALSETTNDRRERAVTNWKHYVVSERLRLLNEAVRFDWTADPTNSKFVRWVAKTATDRDEANYEFNMTARRYEDRYERRLNVAEHIGKLIWDSIQNGEFAGVHTPTGILGRVSEIGKVRKISGARDKDTLREIWKTYRGVVHLGMAMDFLEDNPGYSEHVLHLAERFRKGLSRNCPKGTNTAYVSEAEQYSFIYKSKLWGPRFRDRGLPYDVV